MAENVTEACDLRRGAPIVLYPWQVGICRERVGGKGTTYAYVLAVLTERHLAGDGDWFAVTGKEWAAVGVSDDQRVRAVMALRDFGFVQTGRGTYRLDVAAIATAIARWEAAQDVERVRPTPCPSVYVMRTGAFVKIGHTGNVRSRLSAVRTASPEPVDLVAVIPGDAGAERALHDRFSDWRCSGEWFRFEGPVREWVESLNEEAGR